MIAPGTPAAMETRKRRHIDVCLSEAVDFQTVTTGLERYRLPYNALTQTDLGSIELATDFLGTRLRAPVLIGAMTGGAELSGTINRNLAGAAQQLGIGMMLGSQRIMLDNGSASATFRVRDIAPDVLLIGNIGLTQLTAQTVPALVEALDQVNANALAVHTNPLQEAMQHKGDTDFSGSIARLRDIAGSIGYPVILKEVGHGIGASGSRGTRGLPDRGGGCGRGRRHVLGARRAVCSVRRDPLSGACRVGHSDRTGTSGSAACATRRSCWSLPAASVPGWTRPKRSRSAPMWCRWLGLFWHRRSNRLPP